MEKLSSLELPNLGSNGALLKYSVSAATLTALSWHVYQEYQKKSLSGQSWAQVAKAKRRNAAGMFCAYVSSFHHNLRVARDFLGTGKVEEAMAILVRCLEVWQFRKQTLKALKKHLHPEFFARLISIVVERKIVDCKDVLAHLSSAAPTNGHHVGLNIMDFNDVSQQT